MGEGSVKVKVQVTVDGKKLKNPTVTNETKFDLGTGGEQKGLSSPGTRRPTSATRSCTRRSR